MYIWKFFKPTSSGRRLLVLLMTLFLVSGLVSNQVPGSALAMPPVPPDGEDDQIHIPPPQFNPPDNGFTWSVPPRYGLDHNYDGLVDTYWRASTLDYAPEYLYPETWPMTFFGCQTAADAEAEGSLTNTYEWDIAGTILPGNQCYLTHNFAMQGTYPVTLTVTYQDGSFDVFPQEVYIKDYFIAAIGDSFASGEGNPDIPQPLVEGIPVGDEQWQDLRCHRSANAYPSRAAMALEFSDPHTSVTFINFACSGATIHTPAWDPKVLEWMPPFVNLEPDPNKLRGTGILGSYIGNETDDYDQSHFIPPQIDQLQAALNPPPGKAERQFDALILSAGGNDLHFGEIGLRCLFADMCWPDATIWENPTQGYNLSYFLDLELKSRKDGGLYYSLPDVLAELKSGIDGLSVHPAEVYITQYADQTRKDDYGEATTDFCKVLDDIFWPSGWMIIPDETERLTHVALKGLNLAIQTAAHDYGWQYVDGITSYEVDPDPTKQLGTPGLFVQDENGKGHGYCASDNWIIRADESEIIQGPWPLRRFATAGTLHPNGKGIQVIRDRLLYYMLPNLEATLPGNPPGDPPTFSSSFTSGGLTSQPGANGWFTHSCDSNQNCSSSQVVLQVTAKGSAPLEGASVYLNGQAGCTVSGVTCPTTIITPTNQLIWDFNFTADGIYQMQFSARDSNDQIADYVSEIKVDLHDPVFNPLPGPFNVDESSSITLTAQAGDSTSAILNYDWDLDNDGDFETKDEQPAFSAAALDGPVSKPVGILVTDEAGRFVTATTTINVLNVAPTAAIDGAPVTSPEGTAINLTSEVTDPGAADTFTYDWTVKKDGISYATDSAANFNFTPDDNGSYEVSLSITDDDGGVGTASQTIAVTNVAPVVSNVTVSPDTVNEGSSVTFSGSIYDAGTADAFELIIDWGDGSTPELVSRPVGSTSFSRSHTYADDNPSGTASDTYSIALSIADDDGGIGTGSASVVVNNLAPSLSISAPENGTLYAVNATVNLSASLTDPSSLDTLTCSVNWDDGATESGTLAAGVCTASHVYPAAGVYTIQMTGADDDTGAKTESVMAVVYDPSAGFVTGGGWIDSPAGAYKADESLTGKATFGFVSKYQKGASVPTGNTAFQFDLAGLEFSSTSYEWLVVNQGGTNAQFKGWGMINGAPDPNGNAYKFMLWAEDGSPDSFRIRIWWEDAAGEHDVYDNSTAQAIGGGNIVVHAGK
jgi:hypothetical protein